MHRLCSIKAWLVVTLLWAVAVAAHGWSGRPLVPLDVSATDPATLAALEAATLRHWLAYAIAVLLPPLVVLAAARLTCRGRSGPA